MAQEFDYGYNPGDPGYVDPNAPMRARQMPPLQMPPGASFDPNAGGAIGGFEPWQQGPQPGFNSVADPFSPRPGSMAPPTPQPFSMAPKPPSFGISLPSQQPRPIQGMQAAMALGRKPGSYGYPGKPQRTLKQQQPLAQPTGALGGKY